jgi:hypothetical protein
MGHETRVDSQDTNIEINRLIDFLEEQIHTGMRVPLTNRVAVEEEEFLATVHQLRASIPAELRQARRVIQDRQKIILDAQAEAERIINNAKERAEYFVSSDGVMAEARHRSEEYLRQVKAQNERSMDEIEAFALKVFGEVEQSMRSGLQDVENAKSHISRARVVNTPPRS